MGRVKMRKDGFIDLDKLLNLPEANESESIMNLIKRIESNDNVTILKVDGERQLVLKFNYNGEVYYYRYDIFGNPYIELVLEELAKDFGIPSISYDLAKIGSKNGVISKNYRVKGAKYINGQTILQDFFFKKNPNEEDIVKETYVSPLYIPIYKNTLEDIWAALEYRYKEKDNGEEIVKDLMNKIVNMFIFDCLTAQADRNCNNWQIVEYEDGRVDLVPLFDNIRAYLVQPAAVKVGMAVNSYSSLYLGDTIENFTTISTSECANIFFDKLGIISEENIEDVFKRIATKTGFEIPEDTKKRIATQIAFFRRYFASFEDPRAKR